MNHFKVSLLKSIIRILSCLVLIVLFAIWNYTDDPNLIYTAVVTFGAGFGIAEILGIMEEVFDKRKE